MKVLFAHNNFPAQFRNVAEALREMGGLKLAAIGAEGAQAMEGVAVHRYTVRPIDVSATHPFARRFDAECWRAEHVLMAASVSRVLGFVPDMILAHCGWGETLPLRAVFPKAKLIIYAEFFYRGEGQDVHFDPEGPRFGVDGIAALQCKNASTLLALSEADAGLSPTQVAALDVSARVSGQDQRRARREWTWIGSARIPRRALNCRAAGPSQKRMRSSRLRPAILSRFAAIMSSCARFPRFCAASFGAGDHCGQRRQFVQPCAAGRPELEDALPRRGCIETRPVESSTSSAILRPTCTSASFRSLRRMSI